MKAEDIGLKLPNLLKDESEDDSDDRGGGSAKKSSYEGESYQEKTIFDELQSVLYLSRIFGFAPFQVVHNRAMLSKILLIQNAFFITVILYSSLVSKHAMEGHKSRSALSLFFFRLTAICRNTYAMICLLHFALKSNVCVRVWNSIEDVRVILRDMNVNINHRNTKIWTYLMILVFLLLFGLFTACYSLTHSSRFTVSLWTTVFLPIFNTYLLIFYFSALTTNLKTKCRLINNNFQSEIDSYKTKSALKSHCNFFDENRKANTLLVQKIRTLKLLHLKIYKISKNLNRLFGIHFLYIFVMYFGLGSLHSFTIIRHLSEGNSKILFIESVTTITVETIHMTVAVYGAIIINREVNYVAKNKLHY
ncbi:hypothetical protein RUM44_012378 [Polyplax serrata]|uniref:Gustatory receptor n=1 Tax=Polyplax serrata TaxID=468196 RepID=A0ABR1BB48_POLSC